MPDERVFVTGGTGCIGSWIVRNLVREDVPVVVLTSSRKVQRLKLILTPEELERITFVAGDISELGTLEAAARHNEVNRIIHLAGMQFPFCAADPIKGALVNVAGTVTIFELAKRLGINRLVFASSAAVYGPKTHYADEILPPDAELFPTSHYGLYKVANEQSARVYWQNDGVASIGLRPHTVYGPGRDQGVTSKPTLAMIAAAAGRPYHIGFGGRYQFQFADDVARTFIAAARAPFEGAAVYNVGGRVTDVGEIVGAIEAAAPDARDRITFDDQPLPFPSAFDGGPITEALGPRPETPV
ncbi:MAG TPA: SDR family oxidoreductase, partial [Candidatus Limnocylindrales bacterium]|nr:SDR family oxidoreductase [Candidatus Limnocylindrales bacterium]